MFKPGDDVLSNNGYFRGIVERVRMQAGVQKFTMVDHHLCMIPQRPLADGHEFDTSEFWCVNPKP